MLVITMTILIVLFYIYFSINAQQEDTVDKINSYLSSRTPYRFNANENVDDVTNEEDECAKKIWMIIRHGTRYPNDDDIDDMTNRLSEVRDIILTSNANGSSVLDDNAILQFTNWSPAVTNITEEKFLTEEGKLELFEMAERMQKRYSRLLPRQFTNTTYLLKFTDSQRTEESAIHFARGLFGDVENVYFPEPSDDDLQILKFHKVCTKWINEVDYNPDTRDEMNLFEANETVQEAIETVNRALGLTDELSLTDIKAIYKTCGFETAWFRNYSSPWCVAFDVNTIQVFAYVDDLESYSFDGYAFEINYKQACPAFNDMINFFDDNTTERTSTLYFTHKGTLLKFIAHLGLYRDDEPLLHSNYLPNGEKKWQDSRIGNFATNLAFILLECKDTKKIALRHNEYIIRLPACPDSDFCSIETVKDYYNDSIDNCNFDDICEN